MMRSCRVGVGAFLALAVAGCGGGNLNLSEYAAQGQAVVTVMDERIATLDAGRNSQTSTVEDVRTYWDRRLEARVRALAGLQDLNPPDQIADLAGTGLELFSRLIAAEEALAVRVAAFETVTEPGQWWDTPEGEAVQAVEEEIDALCNVFQAMYDATTERIVLSDAPWIPSEMKEIIQIDIGCQQ